MSPHLTVEQRQLALRLKARGLSLREIGAQVGCSRRRVTIRNGSRRRTHGTSRTNSTSAIGMKGGRAHRHHPPRRRRHRARLPGAA
jgi:Homeodomain-like domain